MNIRERQAALKAEASALLAAAKQRDLTATELARVDELQRESADLQKRITKADSAQTLVDRLAGKGQPEPYDDDPDDGADPDYRWPSAGQKARNWSGLTTNEDPLAKAFVAELKRRNAGAWRPVGAKAVLELGPAGSATLPVDLGAVAMAQPTLMIAQLVTHADLEEGDGFTFLRQTVRQHNAAVVPEGQTKPTSQYKLERRSAKTATIAHLSEPVPRQWLADVPSLTTFLATELSNGVAIAINRLILDGSGVGDEPEGVLNVTGVRAQPFVGSVLRTTRSAVTLLERNGEAPTAWVMTPEDWQVIEEQQDANDRPLYQGVPQQAAARTLHGRPVALSLDLDQGQAILGDFRQVALLTREGIRVDWTEYGDDLFDKNQFKFRAESRAGVAVGRPGAFVVVELDAA